MSTVPGVGGTAANALSSIGSDLSVSVSFQARNASTTDPAVC